MHESVVGFQLNCGLWDGCISGLMDGQVDEEIRDKLFLVRI